MSYVIQIWENPKDRPLPVDIDEASRFLEELAQVRSGVNPKFVRLAERLTQRYPYPGSPVAPGDDSNETPASDWAWSDGPIDGMTKASVYNIGINIGMLEEVRPFVVQEASALGLCLMDEQAGEAYLPGGKVLSMSPDASQHTEADEYDDVPRTKDLAKLIFDRLTPFFVGQGYKARKSKFSFRRNFSDGWYEVAIVADVDRWPVHAQFEVRGYSRFHLVSDLVSKIEWPDIAPDNDLGTVILVQRNWMDDDQNIKFLQRTGGGKYAVRSYSEVDAVVEHVTMKLSTRLLPLLHKCKTIEELDQVFNPVPLSSSPFPIMGAGEQNLITAYLARNPRLQQLSEELSARALKRRGGEYERIQLYIEYIRNHPLEKS